MTVQETFAPRGGRRLLIAALSIVYIACASQIASAQSADLPPLSVSPFVFPAALDPSEPIGALRYRGALVIESDDSEAYRFSGLSGFWVSPDGSRFAGTEGGNWIEGSLGYDDGGNLSTLSITNAGPLLDENGAPFAEDRDRDAEALDHDGTHYLVGFETHDRVLRYRTFDSPAERVSLPPEALEGIGQGTGFSSVAHLPGRGMIALPELTRPERTRGWLITNEGEGAVRLRPPDDFWLPVSLSPFPNGDLLVLEIYQSPQTQTTNVTRLGRISADSVKVGGLMEPVEIATLEPPLTVARFEGSAVRPGPRGETYIYVMYNASPAVLFMFELTDAAPPDVRASPAPQ